MPPSLTRVRSIGPFDGWLQRAIVEVKYHGEWARAEHLAEPLAALVNGEIAADALVPVPLHPARLKQRGFNQSLVIARYTANLLEAEVLDVLVRNRRTAPQVSLGARARRENVENAFSATPDVRLGGRSLVVIDDVITTGSTLAACADTLLHAGAGSVSVVTIAREM
jgi:ComF family protein